ncbi:MULTISPECIES: 1-acyl-sn-glycerol-3-phosphate acyltransferase [unclassified Aureispira]|uniref:lysophospholipid acyltransferase family protein n=1 Tax=unclassified Aureispira TaxID=2649989 RepID=UPI00069855D2|nr:MULTISPECIES: lysophospholipid acyltransferase family protein [unclassified Aureispira]WMX14460.1 lysophospholipid acyltransferase family protein [Aureispira sp. CCB-E]
MQAFDTKSLPAPLRAIVVFMQRLWFAWCCLATLLIGVVALVCYIFIFNFLSGKKAANAAYFVTKWWGKTLLAAMLVRVTSEGLEKIDPEAGAYVLVSNHLSVVDIPICMSTAPVPFSFLAKQEVDKLPIVGYLARNMHVYVDRKSKESRKQTLERMKAHIDSGHSIHIYAEGTRNKTNELLQDFYDGAFKLAIETQQPIVAMTICDSDKVSTPKKPFLGSPAWVHCIWDAPISTKGMTVENDLEHLKTIVRERILHNLERYHATYHI